AEQRAARVIEQIECYRPVPEHGSVDVVARQVRGGEEREREPHDRDRADPRRAAVERACDCEYRTEQQQPEQERLETERQQRRPVSAYVREGLQRSRQVAEEFTPAGQPVEDARVERAEGREGV